MKKVYLIIDAWNEGVGFEFDAYASGKHIVKGFSQFEDAHQWLKSSSSDDILDALEEDKRKVTVILDKEFINGEYGREFVFHRFDGITTVHDYLYIKEVNIEE